MVATLALAAGCSRRTTSPAPGPQHPWLGLTPSSREGAPADSFGGAVLTARATGADLYSLGVNWKDFEAGYGRYRSAEIRGLLAALETIGMRAFVDLHVIETNQRVVPADLATLPFSNLALAARLDDAVDTLVQIAREHPIVALAIGNEVDAYFGAHPNEFSDFLGLFARQVTRIHARCPGLPVASVTLSPLGNPNAGYGDQLHALGDVAVYTYYPFQAGTDFVHRPPSTFEGDMAALRARVPGKPFALQEVGYSSSRVNSPDSTHADSLQADFARRFRAWAAATPRAECLFANWFLYHDFPPAIVDTLTRFYGFDTPGFRGYLGGLGLKRADGSAKPSWNAWRGLPF
jgi:hypothetical protein